MKFYCTHCRKITETSNVQRISTRTHTTLKGKCKVCGKMKTQFTS